MTISIKKRTCANESLIIDFEVLPYSHSPLGGEFVSRRQESHLLLHPEVTLTTSSCLQHKLIPIFSLKVLPAAAAMASASQVCLSHPTHCHFFCISQYVHQPG